MIHLHSHTNYSLLQATARIDDLLKKCRLSKMDSIAITDTNAMNGLVQFSKLAKENRIIPIFGSLITEPKNEKHYIILIAKNLNGYKDLCKIITQRKLNADFSLNQIIKILWKNLILVTPNIEILNSADTRNSIYAEIIPTKTNKKNALETYNYAKEHNIPVIASNPIYFIEREDFALHKLVTSIRLNKTIDSITADELEDEEYYFKEASEINKVFSKIPESIRNTHKIASQCKVDLTTGIYKYPIYPKNDFNSSTSLLTNVVYNGLSERYKKLDKQILTRAEIELKVINDLNFVDYFLIVWDIVQEARKRGMMFIGRGSAANSLVAYALGLTQIDPIKHDLYFERFLNKARSNPPDVDLDFSWKERDEIVRYVFEKYGFERVAMISTTVTFRARSAFRETAKAFGISEKEISRLSKKIPWTNAVNLPDIMKLFPESRNLGFDKEPWRTIVNLASKLANFPRHLSIHPSGLVITPTKITDYCALEYAKNKGLGLIVTQPDMYSIEDLGLIKIDLLSQRSLGVLRDTMSSLNRNF